MKKELAALDIGGACGYKSRHCPFRYGEHDECFGLCNIFCKNNENFATEIELGDYMRMCE
jgi:hypothetical protein